MPRMSKFAIGMGLMKRGAHRDAWCNGISRLPDVVWLVGVNDQRVQLGRRGWSRHGGGEEGYA